MPGKGGNKWKPSSSGRYSEGYGPMIEVIPDTLYKRKKVSDAIRGWGSHNSKTRYGQ